MDISNLTPQERQEVERILTSRRIVELKLNPVKGDFDAAHVKEINRRIFQDLPRYGFKDVTPGVFRSESKLYYKIRDLPSVNKSHFVAYSSMNKSDLDQLNKILESAKPEYFKNLRPNEFAVKAGNLYANLDYIHPFSDGNSRTLREFTRQIAIESGYNLNWEIFNKNQAGRDILYIARDRSVIERSLNHIKDDELLVKVVTSQYTLREMRDLPNLVKDAVKPIQSLKAEHSGPIMTVYAGSIQSGKSAIAAANGQIPQKMAHDGIMASVEQKKSICVETALIPETLKAMNEAKKNGFEVHLHYAHNNHFNQGFHRANVSGLNNPESHVGEFLRDSKENYKNLESGIALSDRAKIYDCSGKTPTMTHDFSGGKLLSGGGYTAPEGIKECSLADNMQKLGNGFEAKVSPEMDLKLSESGMKFKI